MLYEVITNLGGYIQATVTDFDGDTDSFTLGTAIQITVEDDTPAITPAEIAPFEATVQESALAAPEDNSTGTGGGSDTVTNINLNTLVAAPAGADDPAAVSFAVAGLGAPAASGLTSGGSDVFYHQSGNTIVATTSSDSYNFV